MALTSGISNSHVIGLSNFHVAKLITDPSGGVATYESMVHIPEIMEMGIKPNNNEASLYADNQSVDTANTTAEYELTIGLAGLPLEYKGLLLGHAVEGGILTANKEDTAPFFGVAFETMKSNGKKRFVKFTKVKFSEPEETAKTKGQNVEFNTPSLTGKAIYRLSDGDAYLQGDEESADFDSTKAENWFTAM